MACFTKTSTQEFKKQNYPQNFFISKDIYGEEDKSEGMVTWWRELKLALGYQDGDQVSHALANYTIKTREALTEFFFNYKSMYDILSQYYELNQVCMLMLH